jgi:dihydrofolate reductase
MTREGVIGAGNRIPWHLPEELRLFRQLTLGGTVIMGRKTFASLGRPLAQRRNIVISTTLAETPGIILCRDFPSAVATADRRQTEAVSPPRITRCETLATNGERSSASDTSKSTSSVTRAELVYPPRKTL